MGKKGMVRKAMAIGLLVAVGAGCDYGAIKKKNTALETAIKGLQAEKEAQQRQLAQLKTANDQLDAQLVASKQRATSLQGETNGLSTQVAQLSDENKRLQARPVRPAPAKAPRKRGTPVARARAGSAHPITVKGATVSEEAGRVKIRLSNSLLFDPGKAMLKKQARETLAQVGRIVKQRYGKSVVGVEGHTDSTPIVRTKKLFRDNHDLSVRRARAVFDFLKMTASVPESQLFVAGYGATRPEAPNKTRQGRARNRRVEIIIYTQ